LCKSLGILSKEWLLLPKAWQQARRKVRQALSRQVPLLVLVQLALLQLLVGLPGQLPVQQWELLLWLL
jgi:hypothetical protein